MLGEKLAAAVSGARRRALLGADRQVDTAHLLHALLESDPAVAAAFDGGPAQVARVRGYLVQRAVGYRLRWSRTVEDSGAVPVAGPGAGAPGAEGGAPGWSPAAAAAVAAA
ncbi:peptidase, partial [Streptomyces sp. B1866]|nr:peptidase [Streptomyces sp. B1866]